MIGTIFQIAVLRLWNNKQELFLVLVVPVLFFSIFALIFGSGIGTDTTPTKVVVVDDDGGTLTREITALLQEQAAVEVAIDVFRTNERWPIDKLTRTVIRTGNADVIVHIPKDTEARIQRDEVAHLHLLTEGTNPIARQITETMIMQVASKAIATRQRKDQPRSSLSPAKESGHVSSAMSRLPPVRDAATSSLEEAGRRPSNTDEGVSIVTTDVFAADKHNPKIAMYAAGIAVMFLLFSATGAGGSLLEEYEAGTLDRILSSRLSLTELLLGKWLFIACLGFIQLTVMFVWAQLVFHVDLRGHVAGFAVMATCTAAATASLALCLAVCCRSRAQLNGVSIILILGMSALGGSMVPRYIMSEAMQRWGQLTFNAWALDGFKKVFWYDLPVAALSLEVKVLLLMAISLAAAARIFADRWALD